MGIIKEFLKSSTIHGLSYIITTRKLARLLWISIIITGFSVAASLIYASFQSWTESPVKTTIETLPITEITLPKVTVCPPKNTFTNLNYDLMTLENMNIKTGRYHSIRATCIVKFWFFGKNHSGPFIHITWYHLNCQKTSKGALFRGF